jgi:hypothetical protein
MMIKELTNEFAKVINGALGPQWKAIVCADDGWYIDVGPIDEDGYVTDPPAQVYFNEAEHLSDHIVCIPYNMEQEEQERNTRLLWIGDPTFFTQLEEWIKWLECRFNERR